MLHIWTLFTIFTVTILTTYATPIPAGQIVAATTYLILSADISQPPSTTPGQNPEEFNFTVAGDWSGASPVNCSVSWNAGFADVTNLGDKEVNVMSPAAFTCSDAGVNVDMTRIRVEPWFLWELSIQARFVPCV